MKTRHVIAIGILSAITISLIAFGIKSKDFKKPILTSAEDLYPISKKWLINYNLPQRNTENYQAVNTNINFTSRNFQFRNRQYNRIQYYYDSSMNWRMDLKYTYYNETTQQNSTIIPGQIYEGTQNWDNLGYRIVDFETEPNGNLYTFLNKNAKPMYNNDAIIWNGNSTNPIIAEIRKQNIHIDVQNYQYNEGAFINTTGTIQLYIDAACSNLTINGINYTSNLDGVINITNEDIIITTNGTASGNVSHVFTINYFNTRPPLDPQPYPDAGDQIVEVIPIVPMMFQILTMPFSFITTAFNVTLWEGTPYQFNFSNFIYSLIAIAALIFIIKLFTSGFSVIGNYTYSKADKDFKKSQTRLNNAKSRNIERNAPKKTESKVTIRKE